MFYSRSSFQRNTFSLLCKLKLVLIAVKSAVQLRSLVVQTLMSKPNGKYNKHNNLKENLINCLSSLPFSCRELLLF